MLLWTKNSYKTEQFFIKYIIKLMENTVFLRYIPGLKIRDTRKTLLSKNTYN